MADPPRKQPPPLPPRPLTPEPFALLTADPAPDTVRTRRDEMPPPQLLQNPGELEEPPLTRGEAYSLRREIILLREALPPTRDTLSPPSKRQQAAKAVSDVARWTAIAIGVLGVATQVAAMFRPDLVGPLQTLLKLLGGAP
jgi:hypothetical protein